MASNALVLLAAPDLAAALAAPPTAARDLGRVEPVADAAAFAARAAATDLDAAVIDATVPGTDAAWQAATRALPKVAGRGWVVVGGPEVPSEPGVRWVGRDGADLPGRVLAAVEEAQIESALEKLAEMGGPEFVVEMLDMLLAQTPEQVATLHHAASTGDLDAVHKTAHSLKGGCGNFGARAVQHLAYAVEQQGAAHDAAGLSDRLAALTEAWERVGGILAAQRARYAV